MHFMRAISVRSAGGKRRDIRRCNKTAGFALPPPPLSLSLSPSSSGERGAGDYRKGVMRDGGRIPAAPESFRARVSAKAQREASRRDARLLLHPAMPIDARGCCDARIGDRGRTSSEGGRGGDSSRLPQASAPPALARITRRRDPGSLAAIRDTRGC